MTSERGEWRHIAVPYALLVLTMLFWAGNSIVGRAMRDDIPPLTLTWIRWVGSATVLMPFALRQAWAERAEIRKGWPALLLLGLTGMCIFNSLLYTGLHYTTASNALLMQAMIPALVLMLGALFFGDRTPVLRIVGVGLSTVGVGFIVFKGSLEAVLGLHLGPGDLLILGACVVWAIYTLCLRLAPPIAPMSLLLVTVLIGVIGTAPLAWTERAQIAEIVLTPEVIGACLYVSIFPSALSYLFYNAAVVRIGPGATGQTIALMPLFGAWLAVFLLGEKLYAFHVVGMALIFVGIALSGLALVRAKR
ncbi:MAG: DMT family transporter [Novosphingobium sp.]